MQVPERIEVLDDGARVRFDWGGGRVVDFDAATLRSVCPCASCGEPVGRSAMQRVVEGPTPVTIAGAELVGTYAISFRFAPDGHATGIYPFERLSAIEPA